MNPNPCAPSPDAPIIQDMETVQNLARWVWPPRLANLWVYALALLLGLWTMTTVWTSVRYYRDAPKEERPMGRSIGPNLLPVGKPGI